MLSCGSLGAIEQSLDRKVTIEALLVQTQIYFLLKRLSSAEESLVRLIHHNDCVPSYCLSVCENAFEASESIGSKA